MCKTCGYRTNDKTKPHNCATVKAIIHKENEFVPRSGIDTLVANCVNGIKKNIGNYAMEHPEEVEKIHPAMIITLIITNVTINLFLDTYNPTSSYDVTRKELVEFLDNVNDMVKQGIDALHATTADTKTSH